MLTIVERRGAGSEGASGWGADPGRDWDRVEDLLELFEAVLEAEVFDLLDVLLELLPAVVLLVVLLLVAVPDFVLVVDPVEVDLLLLVEPDLVVDLPFFLERLALLAISSTA